MINTKCGWNLTDEFKYLKPNNSVKKSYIPNIVRINQNEKSLIIKMYEEFISLKDIAKFLYINSDAVRAVLKEANITLRDRGQSLKMHRRPGRGRGVL